MEIPFDVKKLYGGARPKVKATVNGVVLRTTVAVYGGKSYVGFRADIRRAAGIAVGDRIRLRLEPDEEVRVVEVPDELRRALAKDTTAKKAFDALAFTHRKELASSVAEAKKPETRARRVAQTLERLTAGERPRPRSR